jgi:acetyl/propionyl-CoA carboxylase alpha subunit
MSESEQKKDSPQVEKELDAKAKAAEEQKALLAKKAKEAKVRERAKKIQIARRNERNRIAAEERKKAAEERNARMARRKEEQEKVEEAKKALRAKKLAEEMAAKKIQAEPVDNSKEFDEREFVDFAVTARKYKTLLTKKYKQRKFWVDPNPYEIQSYIPGTIISVNVKEGSVVEEGTQLLILEAMKMQNRVDMPFTARIKKINVSAGQQIPKDFVMIELEPIEEK